MNKFKYSKGSYFYSDGYEIFAIDNKFNYEELSKELKIIKKLEFSSSKEKGTIIEFIDTLSEPPNKNASEWTADFSLSLSEMPSYKSFCQRFKNRKDIRLSWILLDSFCSLEKYISNQIDKDNPKKKDLSYINLLKQKDEFLKKLRKIQKELNTYE